MKGSNYTVTFKVTDIVGQYGDKLTLEHYLEDALASTIFPALGLEIVPLTIEIKNTRKGN